MRLKLMEGDNMESLKKIPDNYVDSIVTDPPYGLSFMNKKWDYQVPSVEFWKEVYRVLKPGGHVLSFGGTRTYHRMVVNLEDGGFEIRDCISWLYASGFPKSLNVNKQIKNNSYEVCRCKEKSEYNMRPLSETNIPQTINIEDKQGKTLLSELSQQDIPIPEHSSNNVGSKKSSLERRCDNVQEEGELQRNNLYESTRMGKTNGEEGRIYNGTPSDNGKDGGSVINKDGSSPSQRPQSNEQPNRKPGTMADEQQSQKSRVGNNCRECGKPMVGEGIGSALKPAQELICLARKPLSEKTIAENVMKWGTGGLNIDGSRIGNEKMTQTHRIDLSKTKSGDKSFYDTAWTSGEYIDVTPTEGRFPANIILECICDESDTHTNPDCPCYILDKQSGLTNQGHWPKGKTKGFGDFGGGETSYEGVGPKDKTKGGASRFFYNAKVSKAERNMGLDEGEKSTHPTVKPIQLMSYLIKLITPVDGIVLDPFLGSGSTGIAAQLNGFTFIGMEMDEDYFKIAEARIKEYEKYRKFLK